MRPLTFNSRGAIAANLGDFNLVCHPHRKEDTVSSVHQKYKGSNVEETIKRWKGFSQLSGTSIYLIPEEFIRKVPKC